MSELTSQASSDLVDRLAALPKLSGVPREELEWLVAHGHFEVHDAGTAIARKGERVERLWVILSGHVAVHVDRGVGPRRVTEWSSGDVSGMLPYSRMTGAPGDNYLEEKTEFLAIRDEHFPEMIHRAHRPDFVDVEAGIRDTIRVLDSKTKSKDATITLDIEAKLPRVRATGGELNQVWFSLIDNALDAIAEPGRIDLSARRELDRVVVRVVDDGPGIPPDDMPQIFDAFFTTKPPGQGTGLGLELTRRLVRRLPR